MNRILLTAALFLSVIGASAQWTIEHSEGDELKGTTPSTFYYYNADDCILTYAESTRMLGLYAKGKIFNTSYAGSTAGATITVGLYSQDDKLQEKFTMWFDKSDSNFLRTRNAGTMSNPIGQKKKINKIIDHLTTTDGYVRILAPIYHGPDIDAKIPRINVQ